MQLSPAPHNCPCWRLSIMVAARIRYTFGLAVRIFSGCHAEFHEVHGTVGARQGHVMVYVN
jgi:hypothetical protein